MAPKGVMPSTPPAATASPEELQELDHSWAVEVLLLQICQKFETSTTRGESEHQKHHATNVKWKDPKRFTAGSGDTIVNIAKPAPELHVRFAS